MNNLDAQVNISVAVSAMLCKTLVGVLRRHSILSGDVFVCVGAIGFGLVCVGVAQMNDRVLHVLWF